MVKKFMTALATITVLALLGPAPSALAADSPVYAPDGYYWLNGHKVWIRDPELVMAAKEKAGNPVSPKEFGDPPPHAYFFTITDYNGTQYDAYLGLLDYGFFKALNVRYKLPTSNAWTFLLAPESDAKAIEQSDVEADLDRMLLIINDRLEEEFHAGGGGGVGLTGSLYLQYLVQHRVDYINNRLSRF